MDDLILILKDILLEMERFRKHDNGMNDRSYNWFCGIQTRLSNLILTLGEKPCNKQP